MDETKPFSEPPPQSRPAVAPEALPEAPPPVALIPAERFAPGLVIASRYRIVSPLGYGGMGEVYRADDQRLGSSVALKFLARSKSLDPVWRDRLLREVKVAREVTHPNVCRVFDVAEFQGQFFLSMEYIDGEDLSSLLRRIGRFPEDKALEIARQICLGLAAAHEEGVLHRDLKPANVMLDGRGRIKIADFGLAALSDRVVGPEVRSGTLAYMAPEQIEGREVTRQSDIYALGLVLYEVFTGKPYDASALPAAPKNKSVTHGSQPGQPAHGSHAASTAFVLDPAISRVLVHCLKRDPADRPTSCFAVAAMLPGGNPLQAALAAGQTPSPEMVAEAGGEAVFSRRMLTAALALFLIGMLASCWLWDRRGVARVGNLAKSPEALTELARQAIRELGYPTEAADSVGWLNWLPGLARQYGDGISPTDFRRRLKAEHPATWQFSYRQSSTPLAPTINDFTNFEDDTPLPSVGDVLVKLSGSGRLLGFRVRTTSWRATSRPTTEPAAPLDVDALARLTGLPLAQMRVAEPIVRAGEQADERLAWAGSYTSADGLPVRVEVGRLGGKIVELRVLAPWDLPEAEQVAIGYRPPVPAQPRHAALVGRVFRGVDAVGAALYLTLMAAGAWLAIRHVRLGIADLRGGLRLAIVVFVVTGICWSLGTHFPANLAAAFSHGLSGLGAPAVEALVMFAIYVALEPFVRSHWPEKLIAWSRALDARHRDRLVAGEVMIGLAAGAVSRVTLYAFNSLADNPVLNMGPSSFESFPHAVGKFGWQAVNGVLLSFCAIFAVAVVRKWVGRPSLGQLAAFPVVFVLMTYGYAGSPSVPALVGFAVPVLVVMATLARCGLLALAVCCSAANALNKIPMTLSTDAYWWTWTAAMLGAVGLLAVVAYQRAVPSPRREGTKLAAG